MKKILSISTIILMCNISGAQQNTFNKDIELQRFVERGGKVYETAPNIFKLTYPDGNTRIFNFNRSDRLGENNTNVDTTIINMWEIDTGK